MLGQPALRGTATGVWWTTTGSATGTGDVSATTPGGASVRAMGLAEDVSLVRAVWVAARENDVDTLVGLTAPDVDWRPTAVASGALHGHEALRVYLDSLATAGTLVDAHPYSFEAIGDCVIVSGALRLRREEGAAQTVQRWWVYRVVDGKVASVASHASRDDACRDARIQHTEGHPPGGQATVHSVGA
jgi:ketosteroid isomerase-like protein